MMKKGKVDYCSEVSNGESKSSITVYENGNMESKVEKTQSDRLERTVKTMNERISKLEAAVCFLNSKL